MKMWCICTREYDSAIKMVENLPFVTALTELEGMVLSGRSQRKMKAG